MKITDQYHLVREVAASIFFAAFFFFFFFYCRYQIIFHEQQQLFQYNAAYFYRLLAHPGGMALYVTNFLVQFFYYPWLGALILTLLTFVTYIAVKSLFRQLGVSDRFIILSLFPAAAYWIVMYDYEFELTMLLSLVVPLSAFAAYIRIPQARIRYIAGAVMLLLLYFFAPASMLLSGILLFLYELLFAKNRIMPVAYLLLTIILPWLAWKMLYATPLPDAYFAGFPYTGIRLTLLLMGSAWLFTPVSLLFIRFLPCTRSAIVADKGIKSWWLPALSATILSTLVGAGLYRVTDGRVNMMLRMDYEVQCENWAEVRRLSHYYPTGNRLVTYYTNIALYKTGQMTDHFFDYPQTGPNGLFLDWRRNYLTAVAGSEVFYQLGFINEANHWTFEALTSSANGGNSRLLKRLVQTALINEDYDVAAKYLHILKSSLFYRRWANEYLSLLDNKDQIQNLPWVNEKRSQWVKNDFLSGRTAPANLPLFFEEHPENKMAFEYMIMYHLLTKNIEEFMQYVGWLPRYNYTSLPAIFEEAILVHLNMQEADRETYLKYPIRKETYQRFNEYTQAFTANSSNPQLQKRELSKKFGNTYWYYFHFFMPPAKHNE